jgi:hypothetical protein
MGPQILLSNYVHRGDEDDDIPGGGGARWREELLNALPEDCKLPGLLASRPKMTQKQGGVGSTGAGAGPAGGGVRGGRAQRPGSPVPRR